MCGVAGVYDPTGGADEPTAVAMREALAHRGPDDKGLYCPPSRQVTLGFRRLSIMDLSPNGRQPMQNERGDVWVACNGEIYNYPALRRDLEARGHRFRSESDTEVLVHLYEERGPELVQRLNGMFAFALWDETRRRLVLALEVLARIGPVVVDAGLDPLELRSELAASHRPVCVLRSCYLALTGPAGFRALRPGGPGGGAGAGSAGARRGLRRRCFQCGAGGLGSSRGPVRRRGDDREHAPAAAAALPDERHARMVRPVHRQMMPWRQVRHQ